ARAVLLRESGERSAARVVLILAVGREEVLVEAADGLDRDRVDREEGVAVAREEAAEPLVRAGARDDVALATTHGLRGDAVEVAPRGAGRVDEPLRPERLVVGDDDEAQPEPAHGSRSSDSTGESRPE